ncbi:MAG: Wzz/FepE/Etk N-terminal domain-containing protein [Planctomycetota bacterium]|nr:Wzz/FepE/Etk N-terminal domain-containing protein [Planctomycetota bacterium]
MVEEKKEEVYLIDLIMRVVRRWYLILGAVVVAWVCAYIVCFLIPAKYEASGMVVVAPPQFQSEIRPSLLPLSTYRHLAKSDSLLGETLKDTLTRHPQRREVLLEDLKDDIRVETGGEEKEGVPTLIVAGRHKDPHFITDFVNTWLTKFKEKAETLTISQAALMEKTFVEEFIASQKRLETAEEELREFEKRESVFLLENVKKNLETLLIEKKKEMQKWVYDETDKESELALIRLQVEAQESDGRWVGERGFEAKPAASEGFAKEISTSILNVKRRYEREADAYKNFTSENNISRMVEEERRLNNRISEINARLNQLESLIPAKEKEYLFCTERLKEEPQKLRITSSPVESAFWEALLREKATDVSKLSLSHELFNPLYQRLSETSFTVMLALVAYRSEKETLLQEKQRLEKLHSELQSAMLNAMEQKQVLENLLLSARMAYEEMFKQYLARRSEEKRVRVELEQIRDRKRLCEEEIKRLEKEWERSAAALAEAQKEYNRLRRSVESAQSNYNIFKEKLEQASLTKTQLPEDVRIAATALTPQEPVFPDKPLISGIAAVMAFLIAVILVTLREASRLLH